jgi:hypothetical protein
MRVRITTAESVVKTRAASGPAGPKGDTGAAGTTDFNELDNVPATFPPSAHTHPWGEITSTPSTLADYGITDAAPIAHVTDLANPHAVTKAQVGLALVENTALSTWHGSAALNTVAQAAVTAHQAALSIAETQIPNGAILARVASGETITGLWAFAHPSGLKTDTITERTAAAGVTVDGLLIKDGGIPEGAVTAHEAALSIGWSQLTDIPATNLPAPGAAGGYARSNGSGWVRVSGVAWGDLTSVPSTFTPAAHTHPWTDIVSGLPATWAPSAHTHGLADLTDYGAAGGYVRSDGAAWQRVSGVAWGDLSGVPATFAPSAHNHAAGDINSGTLATARGGTNIGSWALGDVPYASATDVLSALAGNITLTRKFLRQVGNGAASAAPAWDTLTAADLAAGLFPAAATWSFAGSTILNLGAVTTADINGGTIDGAAIGGAVAAAGAFTTLGASSDVTVARVSTSLEVIYRQYSATDSNEVTFRLDKSNQNTVGNTATIAADRLGSLTWRGNSGAGFTAATRIRSIQTGAASTLTPGAILFETSDGATLVERMRILSSGYVGIAEAARFCLDGAVATGDTYITSPSANVLDLYAGNAKQLSLTATTATVAGNLIVSGVGPHAIGSIAYDYVQMHQGGTFTSGGASNRASALLFDTSVVGAAGDIVYLAVVSYAGYIRTQAAAESINIVAALYVDEPQITIGAGSSVAVASTVYVAQAPTEASSNYALFVDSGASRFDGTCYIGDTANANMTVGVTINQGAADDQILAFRSTDVATGLTTATTQAVTTAGYATFSKSSATLGGLLMQSLAEDDALGTALRFASYGGTATTTKSTAGRALIELYASEHNGANALADITADGNVFGVLARRGGADVALALLDEDGDLWLGGAATVVGALGCNGAAAQTAYASGGAAGGTATLAGYGFVSAAEMNSFTALVANLRTMLVNNGIAS